MRLFLAFKLPKPVVEVCTKVQKSLRDTFGKEVKANWVSPENLHITLLFLGDLEEGEIGGLSDCLTSLQNEKSIRLEIDKLNWSGTGRIPNVLWISLNGELERAAEVRGKVGEADRPYVPHITLGRVKHVRSRPTWQSRVDKCEFQVDTVQLIKSQLTSEGPKYTVLNDIKLASEPKK